MAGNGNWEQLLQLGSNYRTDTFRLIPGGSQPGAAAGAMYASITGPDVRTAAIADGLINNPSANNKCPGEGHLVALVIAPGWDFHWCRKERTGTWSHKPGQTPAIDVDNSNAIIHWGAPVQSAVGAQPSGRADVINAPRAPPAARPHRGVY